MTKDAALLHAILAAVEDSYQEHECRKKPSHNDCGLCLLHRNLKWRTDEIKELDAKGRYAK